MKKILLLTLSSLFILSACHNHSRPNIDDMEADIATASSGLFGKCMEHLDIAADYLHDARNTRHMIVNSKVQKPDWYYDRGERLAENAAEQRAIAEQVCKEFLAVELGLKKPRDVAFLKGQVYFDLGSSTLSKNEIAKLNKVIASYKRNPAQQVMIVGHTDTTGSRTFNQALSTKRAAAVNSQLKELASKTDIGLPPKRIEIIGAGQVDGRANNKSRSNRRVDIYLVPTVTG